MSRTKREKRRQRARDHGKRWEIRQRVLANLATNRLARLASREEPTHD